MNIGILGSLSSHGGTVITATTSVLADGVAVAKSGDLHSCPIKHHGITPVIGTATTVFEGVPVLQVGDVAGCGAVLITGAPTVITI